MPGHIRLISVVLLAFPFCSVARAQPGQPTKYATIEPGEKESFGQVLFSPAGDSLGYVKGKNIAIWDVKAKQQRKLTYKADHVFLDMDYSPDGRMLVATEFSRLYQIEVSTGRRAFLYQHNDGSEKAPGDVSYVKYSSDGKQILSADRSLRLWDIEKKAEVRRIDPGGFVVGLVPHPICIDG
jgi:WD40 repeat protein